MTNNGGQHGQGDIVGSAYVDPGHHQIEKDVDASPHFGHAGQIAGGVCGGG
nr:hypothetical protein [Dickeya dadantii]